MSRKKPRYKSPKSIGSRALNDTFKKRPVPEPERLARLQARAALETVLGPL